MTPATIRQLPLLAGDGSVRGHAVVDAADFDWLSGWIWRLGRHGYACRGEWNGGSYRTVYLHREIAGAKRGQRVEVDHRNRNRLDCRRSNLRLVSAAANRQNMPAKSGYRGVDWHAGNRKWRARVHHAGTTHFLGYFDSEKDAARAAAEGRARLLPYSVD